PGMFGETPRKQWITLVQALYTYLLKPNHDNQHRKEPREEMITGCGGRVEEGHAVLRQSRSADQPQPRIEPASAEDHVDQNGDTYSIQRNGEARLRWPAQPICNLHKEPSEMLAIQFQVH